jgi:hypothetical protein
LYYDLLQLGLRILIAEVHYYYFSMLQQPALVVDYHRQNNHRQ